VGQKKMRASSASAKSKALLEKRASGSLGLRLKSISGVSWILMCRSLPIAISNGVGMIATRTGETPEGRLSELKKWSFQEDAGSDHDLIDPVREIRSLTSSIPPRIGYLDDPTPPLFRRTSPWTRMRIQGLVSISSIMSSTDSACSPITSTLIVTFDDLCFYREPPGTQGEEVQTIEQENHRPREFRIVHEKDRAYDQHLQKTGNEGKDNDLAISGPAEIVEKPQNVREKQLGHDQCDPRMTDHVPSLVGQQRSR
jgi:hypothetical protein